MALPDTTVNQTPNYVMGSQVGVGRNPDNAGASYDPLTQDIQPNSLAMPNGMGVKPIAPPAFNAGDTRLPPPPAPGNPNAGEPNYPDDAARHLTESGIIHSDHWNPALNDQTTGRPGFNEPYGRNGINTPPYAPPSNYSMPDFGNPGQGNYGMPDFDHSGLQPGSREERIAEMKRAGGQRLNQKEWEMVADRGWAESQNGGKFDPLAGTYQGMKQEQAQKMYEDKITDSGEATISMLQAHPEIAKTLGITDITHVSPHQAAGIAQRVGQLLQDEVQQQGQSARQASSQAASAARQATGVAATDARQDKTIAAVDARAGETQAAAAARQQAQFANQQLIAAQKTAAQQPAKIQHEISLYAASVKMADAETDAANQILLQKIANEHARAAGLKDHYPDVGVRQGVQSTTPTQTNAPQGQAGASNSFSAWLKANK